MNQLNQHDSNFQEWIYDQDLDEKEKTIHSFHRWMRQSTTLSSGTIVDYRKYVAEMLDEDGELATELSEIDSSHRQAAYNKFQEYLSSADNSSTSGDTGE